MTDPTTTEPAVRLIPFAPIFQHIREMRTRGICRPRDIAPELTRLGVRRPGAHALSYWRANDVRFVLDLMEPHRGWKHWERKRSPLVRELLERGRERALRCRELRMEAVDRPPLLEGRLLGR